MRAGIYMLFPLVGWKKIHFHGKKLGKGLFLSKKSWNFIFVTAGHPVNILNNYKSLSVNLSKNLLTCWLVVNEFISTTLIKGQLINGQLIRLQYRKTVQSLLTQCRAKLCFKPSHRTLSLKTLAATLL